MNTIRELIFTYDPWRGGFLLQLCSMTRKYSRSLFDGLMTAFLSEDNRIEAVESFWDHGGLPLRGIHGTEHHPTGTYSSIGDEIRVGTILIRQAADKLAVWFSTGNEMPRQHWKARTDLDSAITAYFSHRKVKAGWPVPGIGGRSEVKMLAGVEIQLGRSMIDYPISSVHISLEDFK